MKRWLVIVGLLVVCIPDMAVAASRSPSLLQQILSVFKPRPTPHYHHTATPKIESPRERPVEAVQPVRVPSPAEAPQSVKASQPVERSQPVMPTQAVEETLPPASLIDRQAIKQAKPAKLVRPVQAPQPVQAKPPIERTLSVVAMRPDLFSEPAQTTQAIKKAKPANAMQAARAPMQVTQPIEPAQPLQAVKAVRFPNIEIVDLRGAGRFWYFNPTRVARPPCCAISKRCSPIRVLIAKAGQRSLHPASTISTGIGTIPEGNAPADVEKEWRRCSQ